MKRFLTLATFPLIGLVLLATAWFWSARDFRLRLFGEAAEGRIVGMALEREGGSDLVTGIDTELILTLANGEQVRASYRDYSLESSTLQPAGSSSTEAGSLARDGGLQAFTCAGSRVGRRRSRSCRGCPLGTTSGKSPRRRPPSGRADREDRNRPRGLRHRLVPASRARCGSTDAGRSARKARTNRGGDRSRCVRSLRSCRSQPESGRLARGLSIPA